MSNVWLLPGPCFVHKFVVSADLCMFRTKLGRYACSSQNDFAASILRKREDTIVSGDSARLEFSHDLVCGACAVCGAPAQDNE